MQRLPFGRRASPAPTLRHLVAALALASAIPAGMAAGVASKVPPGRVEEPTIDITINEHDTLIALARDRFVSPRAWREIAKLNRLPDPSRIYPGQVLRVPERLLRSQPVAARLVSAVGDVRVADATAQSGSDVAEGQRIETGNDGSAVIELADGSRMRLAPSSLAELSASRSYAPASTDATGTNGWFSGAMRVLRGSVEVFATKVLRAKPLEVTTPTAVAGVRGTHYRVDYAEADSQASRAGVLEGRVRLDTADRRKGADLDAGYGGAIDASAAAPTAIALPGPPDLDALPERFERPIVRFTLAGETAPVRVQIAEDPAFDRIVRDLQAAPGAEFRITGLPDSAWYLRARRVGEQGIEGVDATHPFVLKARPEPPVPSRPRADGKVSAGSVEFAWAQNAAAPQARLQVADDDAFTHIVADVDPIDAANRVVALETPGVYHWRLASIRPDGDHGPFGDPLHFEVRPQAPAPTGGVAGDGKSLIFHLGGRPQDHQLVQLARDVEFKNVVTEQELASADWSLPLPAEGGRYYFRYRVKEPDGFIGDYTAPLVVDVPVDRSYLWLLAPLLLLL
ncbi:MAG: FecR domain-containing protein [Proteobacteria bacterium]|nr:FecR domain-containing protein [Pseudomonadota bacterium]